MSAPVFNLPPELASFIAVEFPGPVNASHSSVERALEALGGLNKLSSSLQATDPNLAQVELNLSSMPLNAYNFTHPIVGDVVDTSNIVLKITRRRKRNQPSAGIYSMELAGLIKKTIRFRGMADFQFNPDIEQDSAVDLVSALKTFDIDKILNFQFEPANENFEGDLNSLPPPIFSRNPLPSAYNYKPLLHSVPTTFIRPSGEEITRLINKDRYKSGMVTNISHDDDESAVPTATSSTKPAATAEEKRIVARMKELLEERPVWSRLAICNCLDVEAAKKLINTSKHLFALCSYSFSDGPFRELIIRFGYDPRADVSARKYQRIMLRKTEATRSKAVEPVREESEERRTSHIFDGRRVSRNIGNYQLCDILDRYLSPLLDDKQYFADYCTEKTGWYLPSFYDGFRELLRLKWIAILSGTNILDADMIGYISRLPHDEELAQDRNLLREAFRKREAARNSRAQSNATAEGDEEPGSGNEALGSSKIGTKRRSIKPKAGVKPKPKGKQSKPSIIDRLAPHIESTQMDED